MHCNISYSVGTIKSEVYQHLSSIGKRLKDNGGNIQFALTTLSSSEEGVFLQYVKSSAARIAAEFPELMTSCSEAGDAISIDVSKSRWTESMKFAFSSSVGAALVSCIAYEIISSFAPDFSKKFAEDTNASLQDLRRHLYAVVPPSAPGEGLEDCYGVVELNM